MVQFIRLRGDFWVGAGFISDHRTASQLLSQREAARMVPIFAQPIILAYGTCLSKNFQPFGRRVVVRALRQISYDGTTERINKRDFKLKILLASCLYKTLYRDRDLGTESLIS